MNKINIFIFLISHWLVDGYMLNTQQMARENMFCSCVTHTVSSSFLYTVLRADWLKLLKSYNHKGGITKKKEHC